jgi:hypothetical protein
MVRSKAVHFFKKKIKIFWFFLFCYCRCFAFTKNAKKSCDARFFRSKTVHQNFSDFLKKVKKMGKSAFFLEKCLWSQDHFRTLWSYWLSCKMREKSRQKKTQKKRDFVFWNSFLKMKIGHLFLSILEFKKKVYKKRIFCFLSLFGEMEKYGAVWNA